MLLTAVLTAAEEGGFIALNPETGTTTQGETVAEAVLNLKEATSLYLEEFPISSVRLKSEQIQLVTVGCTVDRVAIELQGARNRGFLEYRDRQNL